jgi:hypothetical protein
MMASNVITIPRELLPCDDCVFCMGVVDGYDDHSYICNLGLDEIFHKRNHTAVDIDAGLLGCIYINDHPTTPCKARYTDEEMQELLGV